jgi:hypothetical protein
MNNQMLGFGLIHPLYQATIRSFRIVAVNSNVQNLHIAGSILGKVGA